MASLVLASCSPRRAALLAEAGFEFETVSPRVQEKFDVDLTLREVTLWNAIRKGMSVAQLHPEKVILAADTLVALYNQIKNAASPKRTSSPGLLRRIHLSTNNRKIGNFP